MGKKLIIKNANFVLNAIEEGPTPVTSRIINQGDLGDITGLTLIPTNYLHRYDWVASKLTTLIGKQITAVEANFGSTGTFTFYHGNTEIQLNVPNIGVNKLPITPFVLASGENLAFGKSGDGARWYFDSNNTRSVQIRGFLDGGNDHPNENLMFNIYGK